MKPLFFEPQEEAVGTVKVLGVPVVSGLYARGPKDRERWSKRLTFPFVSKVVWYLTSTSSREIRDAIGELWPLEEVAHHQLSFEEALVALRAGYRVKRSSWNLVWLEFGSGDQSNIIFRREPHDTFTKVVSSRWAPIHDDLVSSYWEILS